jgi:alkanesulfonate monooxygenase SsuD/methylene tetrahydromethanopterin reductase-like flavin-dependent oxidoreductase (luciferase family)
MDQGHPVIMQAGSSGRGREFAARWAEIIFVGGSDKAVMQEFYQDMHKRIAAKGRDPEKVKIVASITPVVGETEQIAKERAAYLESLEIDEYDLALASSSVGADLSKYKTAEEVEKVRGHQGTRGIMDGYVRVAKAHNITLAEAAIKRRPPLFGTPETIADKLQDLFESRACDGFVIMPMTMILSHEQFCRAVVPELQRRGIFRTEYTGATLRENLAG